MIRRRWPRLLPANGGVLRRRVSLRQMLTTSPRTRPSLRLVVVAVAVGLLVAACDGGGDGEPATTASPDAAETVSATQPVPEADDIDPARLEPLAGLGPCPDDLPPAAQDADTGGTPLPPEAIVTSTSLQGSLRNVQGYSPRTPVEIMVEYLREQDVTAVNVEDEVFESEVLLRRGDLRVFIKSQATCERGSAFVLFASDDPALVPEPAGAAP